jgi:hypothetical protein
MSLYNSVNAHFQLRINSRKNIVTILVNQLVSTFVIFSFEGEGVGQSENYMYVNLVFLSDIAWTFDLANVCLE